MELSRANILKKSLTCSVKRMQKHIVILKVHLFLCCTSLFHPAPECLVVIDVVITAHFGADLRHRICSRSSWPPLKGSLTFLTRRHSRYECSSLLSTSETVFSDILTTVMSGQALLTLLTHDVA